jgi:hypothetical protein
MDSRDSKARDRRLRHAEPGMARNLTPFTRTAIIVGAPGAMACVTMPAFQ